MKPALSLGATGGGLWSSCAESCRTLQAVLGKLKYLFQEREIILVLLLVTNDRNPLQMALDLNEFETSSVDRIQAWLDPGAHMISAVCLLPFLSYVSPGLILRPTLSNWWQR